MGLSAVGSTKKQTLERIRSIMNQSNNYFLYKYSLDANLKQVSTRKGDFVIKLPMNDSNPRLHHCAFFSINGNLNTYEAHDNLALTFYPKACHSLVADPTKYVLEDNRGKRVTVSTNGDLPKTVLRCWPAFGQIGGAREIILVDDSCSIALNLLTQSLYTDGGEVDEYHQDNTTNYDLPLARLIAEILVQSLMDADVPIGIEGQEYTTVGRYVHSSGLSVCGQGRNNKFISISTGFIDYCGYTKVKIWTSLWLDDENSRNRRIYGPLEDIVYLPHYSSLSFGLAQNCSPEELMKTKDYLLSLHLSELRTKTSRMIKRLLLVTEPFFDRFANSFGLIEP